MITHIGNCRSLNGWPNGRFAEALNNRPVSYDELEDTDKYRHVYAILDHIRGPFLLGEWN